MLRPEEFVLPCEPDDREEIGQQIAVFQLLWFENANGKIFFAKHLCPHFQQI